MARQGILGTQRGSTVISTSPNIKDPQVRDVYFGMARFTSYREDDQKAKKLLVGLLGNAGVRKTAVSKAFNTNPCLVTRYSIELKENGIAELLKDERGRPGKTTEEIELFVREQYKRLRKKIKRNIRPKIQEKVIKKFGVKISRELIRQITLPVREKQNLSQQSKKAKKDLLPVLSSNRLPLKIDNGTNGVKLLKKLEVGFYSRYAGGLLLNVFVAKLTEGVLREYKDSELVYDLRTFMIMIIQMVQFDIVNLERVKRINRREFGLLLGIETAPTLKTMRRRLNQAVAQLAMGKISIKLAKNYVNNLSSGVDVFYTDDHLDTYSGKEKVLQGFSHVYDRPMEGIQHSFVHDCRGNPICFELRDNFNNFKELLPVMIKRIKKTYKGKRKPTFVFDRYGYDEKVFAQFNEGLGAYYIVWTKGDKTEYDKDPLKFDEVEFNFRRNVPGKPRKVTIGIAETPKEQNKQRKIVVRRRTSRRMKGMQKYMYSSLVTNDMRRPKEEIVQHLVYRWREECDFKVEINEFGIDQITSYMMEDYHKDIFLEDNLLPSKLREGKMMENPLLKSLRWKKKKIKKEIAKIDAQLGKRAFTQYKRKKRSLAEVSESELNKAALLKRAVLDNKFKEIKEKLSSLPKKVNRLEYLISAKFKTFNLSKKLIMDTLKVCARNVRRMSIEVFDYHYQNYRDQIDFLRRIINNGGQIKLNKQGIVVVEIVPFNTEAENTVLASFLNEINSMKPQMFCNNSLPIKFMVGKT